MSSILYAFTHSPSSGMGAGPCLGPLAMGHIASTCAEYVIIFSPLPVVVPRRPLRQGALVKGFPASSIIKPRVLFCTATLHLFRHRSRNFSSRVTHFAAATNNAVLPSTRGSVHAT